LLVVLFRHGPAGRSDPKRWPDDRERPLTPRGEKRTRQAATGLYRILRESSPERIEVWTSPLVRARQTAKRVADAVGEAKPPEPVVVAALAPGGSTRSLLERLSTTAAGEKNDGLVVILVGHEPDLGQVVAELLVGVTGALPLKKAGACAVSFEVVPRRHAGTLEWFVPPRLLRRIARRRKDGDLEARGKAS